MQLSPAGIVNLQLQQLHRRPEMQEQLETSLSEKGSNTTISNRHSETVNPEKPWRDSVRIQPAVDDVHYRKASICTMSCEELQRLDFGYQSYLYIDSSKGNPVKLQDAKVSIPALCALSPVIQHQIRANGPESIVDHIALPPGNAAAYRLILQWLDTVILDGELKPIPTITKNPLTTYYQILEIAKKLHITPITGNLGRRYERMLAYTPGQFWNVQLADIRELYQSQEYGPEHPLRKRLVENLARARMAGDLKGKRGRLIEELSWEIGKFWEEVEVKMRELGWEGE